MDRVSFGRRLTRLGIVLAGLVVVLAVRLWQVQIIQGEYHEPASLPSRRIRNLNLPVFVSRSWAGTRLHAPSSRILRIPSDDHPLWTTLAA